MIASRARRSALWLLALSLTALPSGAQFMTGRGLVPESGEPADSLSAREIIDRVGFDQRLGENLPLDARFRDEAGREVLLGDYFGARPVVLAMVYYRCPVLCTLVERGAAMAAKPLGLTPGRDFDFVFVSFDPTDDPERASEKKARTLVEYGGTESASGWHFLSGDETSIRRLTEAVGFRYVAEPGTGQFAHASGLVVATPDGRISRYLYGAEYAPRDLNLALVESSDGRIGGAVEKLMLYCFRYDAGLGRYTATSLLSLRLAAALTLVGLLAYFALTLRRDRHARRLAAGGVA